MSRVQSIERAFAVMATLAQGPLGVTDVADRARLPKSTAARLLASMARESVVEQIPGETRWRLGPRIVTLAEAVRPTRSIIALTHPQLVELAEMTGEAAGLSLPDGYTVHYVNQVDSRHPVGVRDWTGTRLPMHTVSAGHVFLAHLPPTDVERFLEQPLEQVTRWTVTDPGALRKRLRVVQLSGVAWTREEFAEGIVSVASPVVDDYGKVVAAIHVHGPSYRFPTAGGEAEVAAQVLAAAARASAALRRASSGSGTGLARDQTRRSFVQRATFGSTTSGRE